MTQTIETFPLEDLPISCCAGEIDGDTELEGSNLDGEPASDLAKFVGLCTDPITCQLISRTLFPKRSEEERKEAMILYITYASFKAAASTLRAGGYIQRASALEEQLDSLYKEMPEWARW